MWHQVSYRLFSVAYIPHGHCYLWQTPLVGLHVVSNLLIAIAYFSIPAALLYFTAKQKGNFPIRLIVLFSLFIVFCGIGHLLDIVTLWYPIYWVSGAVRAATALVSCYTAIEVAMMLPTFLALKNPLELEKLNRQLTEKVIELTAAENELETSQKVFKGAFEYAPIGMALVAENGHFLKVNKALSQMLGYTKQELLKKDFQSITCPDDLAADFKLVRKLKSGKHKFLQLEKHYFHQQGHTIDVQLSASLLKDSADNTIFIAHIQDISEQKRTASLKVEKQAADAANRAKGDFLAMMSHEIRTPMNALIGMTDLLHDAPLSEQQQNFVDVIATSGNTLLTLINDILDFSKIESNKLALELSCLDLYKCLEDVLALYSHQAEKKGLDLTLEVRPVGMPNFFEDDGIRLRQILGNLVNNSIKFTDRGGVSIHIQLTPVATLRTDEVQSTPHTPYRSRPLKTLLTEDISLNQEVALTMISTLGCSADIASNGKEAVATLQTQAYDLVFMEIQMPEMDGLEATRIIRSSPHVHQPYIVAMTAHAMQRDKEECLSAGMNDYISKPIRKQTIAAVLAKCPTAEPSATPQPSDTDILSPKIPENPPTTNQAAPAPNLEEIPILNTHVLEQITSESAFIKEIYHSFLSDAPPRLQAIKTALESGNASTLEQTAHAFKSLSSCIGAMTLFHLCKQMEIAGKTGQVTSAAPLIHRLEADYKKVQLAIDNHQKQLESTL